MHRVIAAMVGFLIAVGCAHAASRYDQMHNAIEKNDVAKVQALLKGRMNTNQTKDSRAAPTFLTQAARLGRAEIASLLIASGANVNFPDGDQSSPLMHAAENGHLSIVEMLLKAGADLNETNKWGETALFLAKRAKQKSIVAVLEKAGAKQ
jgi:ankyrin repeat protein